MHWRRPAEFLTPSAASWWHLVSFCTNFSLVKAPYFQTLPLFHSINDFAALAMSSLKKLQAEIDSCLKKVRKRGAWFQSLASPLMHALIFHL
jgi:hypothetical protein